MARHGIAHGERRIGPLAVAVCSRGVTHDELRSLLAPYAAGTLPREEAEALRDHLATGCTACLDALFRLPVGLPRTAPDDSPPVAVPIAGPSRTRAVAAGSMVVVALAVALLASLLWMVQQRAEIRRLRAAVDDLGMRLEAVQHERAAFGERLESRGRELAEARASARDATARHEEERRLAEETRADLERDLAAAQARVDLLTRGVQRRDREIERLADGPDDGEAVRELLRTPGLQLLRLEAVSPFRDGRGHALWHPARDVVVVYVFGLPALPSGGGYRISVMADGADAPARTFQPGPRGEATITIRLGGEASVVREVAVTRDASEEPVLAGRSR
jgi:hypothetical protein